MPDVKIDPQNVPCEDVPLVVLVDDRNSFIGFGIKNHSKGCYNHVMIMHKPGRVASMDFSGFHDRPITDYMRRNLSLKFWKYAAATETQNLRIILECVKHLPSKTDPWYKKLYGKFSYDFVGIAGQLFNIRWLQLPWKWYCSEITMKILKTAKVVPDNVPNTKSPEEINKLCKTFGGWEIYGRWWSDDD